MTETILEAKNFARIPKAPLPKKLIIHKQGFSVCQNENLNEIRSFHKHSRSYGRIPPTVPSPRSIPTSSAITPSQALLSMHEGFSKFELKEVTNYKELYYLGSGRKTLEGNLNDNNGYYRIMIDDHILYRYQILEILGQGSFGTVVKCRDHKEEEIVAIKILRKSQKIKEYGKREINFFNLLETEEDTETCIVSKLTEFLFREHLCIVFEILSLNLYDFLKKNQFRGISACLARRITTQVLIALKHSHSVGITHCDIKPENIVFERENKSGVKIIDFGSAWNKGEKTSYIQSRFYRAPEVILETVWDEKIDIWSLGCVLFEIITGWPIFSGENEVDVFISMVKILGMPPKDLFAQKRNYEKINVSELEKEFPRTRGRNEIDGLLFGQDPHIVDFLKRCLKWKKEDRISAEEGLAHVWIRGHH